MRHHFLDDPRILSAKDLIQSVIAEYQSSINSVRPSTKGKSVKYKDMIEKFGHYRGGNLVYPYLSSGIGNTCANRGRLNKIKIMTKIEYLIL